MERSALYECPQGTLSCVGGSPNYTTSNTDILDNTVTCAPGYKGILCAICADDYYMAADRTCAECAIGGEGAAAGQKVAYVTIALIGFSCFLFAAFLYLRSGVDEIICITLWRKHVRKEEPDEEGDGTTLRVAKKDADVEAKPPL
jgi:hypothetical protein